MKLIAAVSKEWGIGKDNDLLFSIPTDMKFFRETTKGHTVIMGRKTLESFPGGKPLKNRRNIVLSRTVTDIEGAETVSSVDEINVSPDEEVFVIGGESIYRLMLDMCDTAYITKVDASREADAFFPDLDSNENWVLTESGDCIEENGVTFRFCTYKRVEA